MITDAIEAAFNAVVGALEWAVVALIEAWPIDMPPLPSLPPAFLEAVAWIKWSPLPVDAAFALFGFLIGVELAWQVVKPVLRWAKAVGDDA
jgi:hypothetical protein